MSISAAPPAEWVTRDPVGPVQQSADLAELAQALVQFQSEVTGAKKGGKNPHFRSNYTRLEDAWNAARDALTGNSLSVTQWPTHAADGVAVTTRILHASGQWMQSTLVVPLDTSGSKNLAQQYGSTLTYAQRYAFLAALGLPPADDDGEGARRTPASKPKGLSAPAMKKWVKEIDTSADADTLRSVWEDVKGDWHKMTEEQRDRLASLKDQCKEQLLAEEKLGAP